MAKKKGPSAQALVSALEARDLDKVKSLLGEGANPNAVVRDLTMLFHAFVGDRTRDDPAPVALLLDAGADIEKTSDGGTRTPLSEAALMGRDAICKLLLERGADVRFAKKGRGVLHAASQSGLLWLVERALEAGVDPRVADAQGETPLHDASFEGRLAVAERLIDAGADVNAAIKAGDYKGFTPLKFAVLGGFPKLTELLLDRGATIKPKDHPLTWLLNAMSAEEDYGKTWKTAHVPEEVRLDIAAMTGAHARGKAMRPALPDDPFVKVAEVVLERGGAVPKRVADEASSLLQKARSAEYERAIERDDAPAIMALLKDGVPRPEDASLIQMAAEGGALNVTRALLKAGEDPNEFDIYAGTALHAAVRSKNRKLVELLLDAGCDIERWTEPEGQEYPESPLWIACAGNDLEMVKLLLDRGASPSCSKKLPKGIREFLAESGCLPICQATDPKILKMLIERGADPNLGKPLHLRVEDEDVEAARALLEAGADPNLKSEDGDLLLEMAMEQDDTALFALLLDHGAKFGGHKPPPGLSAEQKKLLAKHGVAAAPKKLSFRDAITYGSKEKVLERIKRGEDLNKKDKEDETPLIWAINAGQEAIALLLLEHGAKASPKLPHPPLFYACKEGMTAVVKELLRRGASPNLAVPFIEEDEAMLHVAARFGHIPIVEALLDAGADVNEPSENEETAIFPAAYWARPDLVRLLIKRGADVNRIDKNKHSLLRNCFWGFECDSSKKENYIETLEILLDAGAKAGDLTTEAAERGRLETLEVLARKGALDPNEGETESPLYMAAREGHEDVARFLLDRGADPTRTSSRLFDGAGRTPLHAAAAKGHAAVVRLLLERGANPSARDEDGKAPIDDAEGREVRQLLRKAGAARGLTDQ